VYYSTRQIADFLGVKRSLVNYYIRKGYLKSSVENGFHRITKEDYYKFRDNYFDEDKRNSNRGVNKKLTEEQVIKIDHMIHDTTNDYISIEKFKSKYENEFFLMDIYKSLLAYKIENS
jgi:predicted transcriptional regulator